MLKKSIVLTAILTASVALGGCASIVTGTNQSLSVKTGHVYDATCKLENDKGTWYVNRTPGSVTVHRSYANLNVSCRKPGYLSAFQSIRSTTKPMVLGNAVFGGVIGVGVDTINGAAYDYPEVINVPLQH